MLQLRVALIGAGVMAFAVALRTGIEWARWVGMACLVVALALRFVARRQR